MKPNFIDPEMTHSRAAIAAQNREVDRLCGAILPQAQALVEQGVALRTALAAEEVLLAEAGTMLKSMLAEFDADAHARTDAAPELIDDGIAADEMIEDQQHGLDRQSADFALAAALFWQDLSPTETEIVSRQDTLIGNLREGRQDDALAAFDLIAARFNVGVNGRALLSTLYELTQPVFAVVEVSPFIAEPYLYAGTINTST